MVYPHNFEWNADWADRADFADLTIRGVMNFISY